MTAEYARRSGRAGVSLPGVVALEQAGDRLASAVLQEAGAALGTALGGLANAVGPELVLLGGGVVAGANTFVEALAAAIPRAAVPTLSDLRVERGCLGIDAAVVGAAVAARARAETALP